MKTAYSSPSSRYLLRTRKKCGLHSPRVLAGLGKPQGCCAGPETRPLSSDSSWTPSLTRRRGHDFRRPCPRRLRVLGCQYHFTADAQFGAACTDLVERIERQELVGFAATHV